MIYSEKRQNELEILLRRLRQKCFDSDKAAELIPVVKAALTDNWTRRAEEHKHDAGIRFMNLMT